MREIHKHKTSVWLSQTFWMRANIVWERKYYRTFREPIWKARYRRSSTAVFSCISTRTHETNLVTHLVANENNSIMTLDPLNSARARMCVRLIEVIEIVRRAFSNCSYRTTEPSISQIVGYIVSIFRKPSYTTSWPWFSYIGLTQGQAAPSCSGARGAICDVVQRRHQRGKRPCTQCH